MLITSNSPGRGGPPQILDPSKGRPGEHPSPPPDSAPRPPRTEGGGERSWPVLDTAVLSRGWPRVPARAALSALRTQAASASSPGEEDATGPRARGFGGAGGQWSGGGRWRRTLKPSPRSTTRFLSSSRRDLSIVGVAPTPPPAPAPPAPSAGALQQPPMVPPLPTFLPLCQAGAPFFAPRIGNVMVSLDVTSTPLCRLPPLGRAYCYFWTFFRCGGG